MTEELQGEKYAVIEAGWNVVSERFVIAYREQKSLRELTAGTSRIELTAALE